MDTKVLKLYDKINNENDGFVMFSLSYCGYCNNAKKYLKSKNIKYKNYIIDKHYDIFLRLLGSLSNLDPSLGIDPNHKTYPIIFFKKKFIGGYTDLINFV